MNTPEEREAPSEERCAYRYDSGMPGGGVCLWPKDKHPNANGCNHAFVPPAASESAEKPEPWRGDPPLEMLREAMIFLPRIPLDKLTDDQNRSVWLVGLALKALESPPEEQPQGTTLTEALAQAEKAVTYYSDIAIENAPLPLAMLALLDVVRALARGERA